MKPFTETTIFHWAGQLIGNSSRFIFNLSAITMVGVAYAFKLSTSPVLLGVFGLINPVFLTICVYRFIQELPKNLITGGISLGPFSGKRRRWMLLTDVSIIIALTVYIFLGPLNYFVFRALLMLLLPMMLLVGLRFLYIIYLVHQNNPTPDQEL
ncbi:hypothetical protein [Williamwhitmania taraxaci]|uniref:Uncharacterized protein n=1 Tax=Williamwhitmania taraxaci TaxID=1640674 RepID=A0A1G6LWB3_9BACT|nr:hypothetical protein [Williamwhitmania taraxaci]SDC47562.1 hypothetical protein SAMN05216323_103311 [Williamwhitmania taraxaci]